MSKIVELSLALKSVKNNGVLALGGNVLHRSPVQFVRALANSGVSGLHLVKTAVGPEVDLLCAANCVSVVSAGFVGYETEYGLCAHYRKAVEKGVVKANEHACYSVITGLRAAACGVPFLPIRGFDGSDLKEAIGLKEVEDPYTGERVTAIAAIVPDVAVLHVQKADRFGNCEIMGPQYEDQTIARAAKHLIVTCEEIVPDDYFGANRKADLSGVLVDMVVHISGGASPSSCPDYYGINHDEVKRFKAIKTESELHDYLKGGL